VTGLAPDYPVQTKRLALRPVGPADVDDLLAYRSLPEVCRYVPFTPQDRATVIARLSTTWAATAIEAEGDALSLGIERRDSGRLIGDVILMFHSAEHLGGEIGWVLNPTHSGQGFMTEAATALVGLAFDQLGLRRVVARVDSRNTASLALARRLGMRQEAHLIENELFKGEWTDEIDFAMLAAEWRSRSDGDRSGC
jgi:RimJ/RimL family protein N-acetyltransferase